MIAKTAKKQFVSAKPEQYFWVWNGSVLKNMRELRDAMHVMSEAQFTHHVTREKNDFATWVSEVLGDAKCAKELAKAKLRETTIQILEKALKEYQ